MRGAGRRRPRGEMTTSIAVGLLAAALAVLAWGMARRRDAGAATKGAGRSVAPVDMPVDATAYAEVARMRRDWMLPLVELAFEQRADAGVVAQGDAVIAAAAQALERFGSEPHRLPRRPQLLPQLLGTLNDEASSGHQIAALIGRDPTLAGNLLKLANSALYRVHSTPVESLDRAVALVGTQGLRRLVAVALMQPVMRVEGGAFGRLPELVWEHTQYAALAAEDYARKVEDEDGFAAQLLVLLQGLGIIVVMQALRDACAGRGPPAPEDTAGFLQSRAPRIAQLMARDWGLSERSLRALEDQARSDPGAMSGLGRALLMAGPVGLASMRVVRDADPQELPGVPA